MEVESLQSSYFYQQVRSNHADLWAQASTKRLVLCVPQNCSLSSLDVSRRDVETHLLKPSRSDPGEFTSVNGKKLSCVGSEMRCRKGFAEPVTARVLSSEEVKVATGDVSVLFLNRPLEGGIDAPGGVDDMDTATVRGFVAMLRSFPENQVAFQRLDKFIKTLHKFARNGELSSVIPSVKSCVQSQCEAASKMMFNSGCFNASPNNPSRKLHYDHLRQVMESYTMEAIHEPIFRWLAACNSEQTVQLGRQLSSMIAMSQSDMSIKTHFQTDFTAARDKLGELARYRTPLEKLQCLRDVSELVQFAVENHLSEIGIAVADVDLSTDDLLNILLYIIVQAHPVSETIAVHLQYIKRFHFVNSNTSVLAYTLANFEVAVDWFLSKTIERHRRRHRREGESKSSGRHRRHRKSSRSRRSGSSSGRSSRSQGSRSSLESGGVDGSDDGASRGSSRRRRRRSRRSHSGRSHDAEIDSLTSSSWTDAGGAAAVGMAPTAAAAAAESPVPAGHGDGGGLAAPPAGTKPDAAPPDDAPVGQGGGESPPGLSLQADAGGTGAAPSSVAVSKAGRGGAYSDGEGGPPSGSGRRAGNLRHAMLRDTPAGTGSHESRNVAALASAGGTPTGSTMDVMSVNSLSGSSRRRDMAEAEAEAAPDAAAVASD